MKYSIIPVCYEKRDIKEVHMTIKKYVSVVAGCVGALAVVIGCIGCSSGNGNKNGDTDRRGYGGIPVTTEETSSEAPKRYNAEDIVVITEIDTANGRIKVKKLEESAEFVLSYNGGTIIKSKYDNHLMMEQMSVGEIVGVCYISGTQKLIEMYEYGNAWENNMVTRWMVDYDKKRITIGSNTYSYDDNIFLTSNGKSIDIREISGIDELTVRGVGNMAYSVSVNKGHGFVRLTNTVNYVGGIVEVGNRISTVITEDMIIAAPEGEYTLTATIKGVGGSKDITVVRGQETVVSLGSFEQAVTRYGTVHLNVMPEDADATLLVDGVQTDYSDLLSLAYGTHKLTLTSNNYDEVTKDITISSVYTTININMCDETGTETTDEPQTTSGESETTSASHGNPGSRNNLISITSPVGAKVYFDGAYAGIAPLSFQKVSGEHTIIFKQDGYVTKSYTIDVSADTEDMILSFPAMLAE